MSDQLEHEQLNRSARRFHGLKNVAIVLQPASVEGVPIGTPKTFHSSVTVERLNVPKHDLRINIEIPDKVGYPERQAQQTFNLQLDSGKVRATFFVVYHPEGSLRGPLPRPNFQVREDVTPGLPR